MASPLIPSHCQISLIRRDVSPGAFAGSWVTSDCDMGKTITDRERVMKWVLSVSAGCILLAGQAFAEGWPQYGGDQGGQRHSSAAQITPANVGRLAKAWGYSTGVLTRHAGSVSKSAFENTPILAEGKLF